MRDPRLKRMRPGREARIGLTVALLLALGCGSRPEATGPNVILFVIDTLRADHLDLYGYPEVTAPFLTGLAESSAVFTRAHSSSSWTAPATASLFTGLDPTRHGVTFGIHAHRALVEEVEETGGSVLPLDGLPTELETLPEVLRRQGYYTYGVSSNLNVGKELGFSRGFDRFKRDNMAPAAWAFERLRRWEDEIRSRPPFFLYLHLNDVHSPYEGRDPWYRERSDPQADVVAAYDSEIRDLDGVLEQILGHFDPNGAALVIVMSDHGEEFWERGELGHLFSLHAEVSRIPLLIRRPGATTADGLRVRENVGIVDVLPTLLELVGATAPEELSGRSLVPLLSDSAGTGPLAAELEERALLSHRRDQDAPEREMWALVQGPWKLIEMGGDHQLYQIDRDPAERDDLAGREPERTRQLAQHLAARRAHARTAGKPSSIELDRATLDELRALGYVEEPPAK